MPRLPTPGGDSGSWGTILNEFLAVGHDASGNNIGIVVEVTKSSNYTLTATDSGTRIVCTASLTISVPAVGTLGNGFECEIVNDAGATVTIDGPGTTNVSLSDGTIASVLETNGKQRVLFTNSTSITSGTPAAPVAAGAIGERLVQENTGVIYASYATAFTGSSITYSIDGAPTGITINASSGVITFSTNSIARQVDTTITLRATNGGGTATNTFNFTCGPQIGVVAPNNLTTNSANRAPIIAAAQTMNCKHIRFDFVMPYVFTSSTGRNWAEPDDLYNRATTAGITPLFVAKNLPSWAYPSGGTYQSYPDATARAQIASALQEAAARYPLANWEFQNEQNHVGFAPQLDPEGYMTYASACVSAIKTGSPSALVISNGLSNAPLENPGSNMAAETFLQRMYDAGAASVFDGIGDHPYSWPNAPSATQTWNGWWIMVNRLRPIMVTEGDSAKQIWMTEYGGPTAGTNGGTYTPITEQQQADHILEAWKMAAAVSWAGPLMIYAVMDRGADGSDDTEDHYGVYEEDGTTQKIAASVMQTIKKGT